MSSPSNCRKAAISVFPAFMFLLLTACASVKRVDDPLSLAVSTADIPEQALLDVDVVLLAPLVDPVDEDDSPDLKNLRRAESYYVSSLLAQTLKRSGQWGVVRVNPAKEDGVDITVSGEIQQSDGQTMRVAVRVEDAAHRTWLDTTYVQVLDADYYSRQDTDKEDPFIELYRQIANDIAAYRENRLDTNDAVTLHQVARLQFANRFAPGEFSGYFTERGGRLGINRMPARDDPVFNSAMAIRARNDSYLELLQSRYSVLVGSLENEYTEFRRRGHETTLRINRQLTADPTLDINRLISPEGVISSSPVAPTNRQTVASDALAKRRLQSNTLNRGDQAVVYSRILNMMGHPFELELSDTIMDFEGRSVSLSGTVEEQYRQWQDVLKEMYRLEQGGTPQQ